MNFLFLFGLIFLSACVKRIDKKDNDTKASKTEININEGGAFVTPSKDLKALRLHTISSTNDLKKHADSLSVVKVSKESLQAKLYDIPVILGSTLVDGSIDTSTNKCLIYHSSKSFDSIAATYTEQLQYFGWNSISVYSEDVRTVIVAKKPHKIAVFLLETNKGNWLTSSFVTITVTVSNT